MRYLFAALVACVALAAVPGVSHAQYRYMNRNYGYAPAPYYYGPPVFNSTTFVSPYGYRSYYNSGLAPGPYGATSFYNSGTTMTPYVAGAYHSVYFNPITNSYQYMGSPANTPNYSYGLSSPYPAYPTYPPYPYPYPY
ncbi:MAG: hypothetical protein HY040_17120 [Planctomycetes bacterium]|nr:hypothetical protein [Planctomycetota bacterium]